VGRSVAPIVGGMLILLSHHAVYLGCALAGALALAFSLWLPRVPRTAPPVPASADPAPGALDLRSCARQIVAGLRAVGRSRIIRVTSLTEALQYLAFGAVETFLPLYARSRGISDWQIGLIFGAQIITLA